MAPIDWRRPETYEKIHDLDAVGFAWEYLRRNPDYRRAYIDSGDTTTAFGHEIPSPVRHWGLSFPGRSRAFNQRTSSVLVIIGCAGCHPPCSRPC